MKKCFPIILIVTVLMLVAQVVGNYFVTEREAEYVLKIKDVDYHIDEKLTVIDDTQYYDFNISDGVNSFVLAYEGDLNKQMEVITDVKSFKFDDLKCIFPVYRRDKTGDVSCIYEGEQVNYSYLRQINNLNIEQVISSLKKDGFSNPKWEYKNTSTSYIGFGSRGIDVYQENILKNYTFLIWRYRGLYILKEKKSVAKDFIEYDQYDNKLSALVGRYYVAADPASNTFKLSELKYYNTKEMGRGTVFFDDATSTDYYFNGVFKDKLYLTDVGFKKQYAVDPHADKIEEVGNVESGFKAVKNNKLISMDANEFLEKPVIFTDSVENKEISKLIPNAIDIKKQRKFYYVRTSLGEVYRIHEDNINHAEKLFQFTEMTEWVVKNGDVLTVVGDTVYFYTDEAGIVPIAKNSELIYNHKNICDFWEA